MSSTPHTSPTADDVRPSQGRPWAFMVRIPSGIYAWTEVGYTYLPGLVARGGYDRPAEWWQDLERIICDPTTFLDAGPSTAPGVGVVGLG